MFAYKRQFDVASGKHLLEIDKVVSVLRRSEGKGLLILLNRRTDIRVLQDIRSTERTVDEPFLVESFNVDRELPRDCASHELIALCNVVSRNLACS